MATSEEIKKLDHNELAEVVRQTPLVSVDLIIENSKGRILIGMRNNEPAKGFWFVPGGRILKNERISQAFERIMKSELGLDIPFEKAEFLGYFEHLYPTNFSQQGLFGTHYIVLAHKVKLDEDVDIKSDDQHSDLQWFDKERMLNDKKVHLHTKWYFQRS